MIKYQQEPSPLYQQISSGLVKVENVVSEMLAKAFLMMSSNAYVREQIEQRVMVELKQRPALGTVVDLDNLIYTLGSPVKSRTSGNYYVPLVIFALKKD